MSSNRRAYIAGPITGHADLNRPAFTAAATAVVARGWEPVDPFDIPATHDGPCPDGVAYPIEKAGVFEAHPRPCWIRADLVALLACDVVALLPGWRRSPGARLERQVAIACGLDVVELDPAELVAP